MPQCSSAEFLDGLRYSAIKWSYLEAAETIWDHKPAETGNGEEEPGTPDTEGSPSPGGQLHDYEWYVPTQVLFNYVCVPTM